MSEIHKCNDGGNDVTGKGTPNKIPCENQGGEVGKTPMPTIETNTPNAGQVKIPLVAWYLIGGVALFYVFNQLKNSQ